MNLIPSEAKKIEVTGATVDFFELEKDGDKSYYFDSSESGPPEPMVNAMSGLKLIENTNDRLIMINHTSPGGLFAKLGADIESEIEELKNGLFKITFKSVHNAGENSDLNDATCS